MATKSKKPEPMTKPFAVTNLTRSDLVGINGLTEADVHAVTDAQMERLASKLGDAYIEHLYWTSLEILSEGVLKS